MENERFVTFPVKNFGGLEVLNLDPVILSSLRGGIRDLQFWLGRASGMVIGLGYHRGVIHTNGPYPLYRSRL